MDCYPAHLCQKGLYYNSVSLTVVVGGTVELVGATGWVLQMALSGGIVKTYIIISRR